MEVRIERREGACGPLILPPLKPVACGLLVDTTYILKISELAHFCIYICFEFKGAKDSTVESCLALTGSTALCQGRDGEGDGDPTCVPVLSPSGGEGVTSAS